MKGPTGTQDLIDFIDASPSPFHAVHSVQQHLEKAGFVLLREREAWSDILKPGGKYMVTRNSSTLVAFAIGENWKPGNPIAMIGTHTDSPCLRIKPISKQISEGYMKVGVECYGDGLWHTWFDRSLGIAGRIMVRQANGNIEQRLVCIREPVLHIPNLAVHFLKDRDFAFNPEDHLLPIAGLPGVDTSFDGSSADVASRHHPLLLSMIAAKVECSVENILDVELSLFDTQGVSVCGLSGEFISGSRLDDLEMVYCGMEALTQSLAHPSALDNDGTVRLVACFDHEEIGSDSAPGADGNFLPAIIQRLSCLRSHDEKDMTDERTAYEQTLTTSFLISADMEHATHPNYAERHEAQHHASINGGVAIKVNANLHYVASSPAIAVLQECARLAKSTASTCESEDGEDGVPLQLTVARNDQRCGSTNGPLLCAKLGCRGIDVGAVQFAMHSIRETAGSRDVEYCIRLFRSFWEHYGDLESKVHVD